MHGGMKVYRGAAKAARNYVEADRSRVDDYYLAEGSGLAMRFVARRDAEAGAVDIERRPDMDGEAYETWVAGIDLEIDRAKGRLRSDAIAAIEQVPFALAAPADQVGHHRDRREAHRRRHRPQPVRDGEVIDPRRPMLGPVDERAQRQLVTRSREDPARHLQRRRLQTTLERRQRCLRRTGSGGQLDLCQAARSARFFNQIGPIHPSTISPIGRIWSSGWRSSRTYLSAADHTDPR